MADKTNKWFSNRSKMIELSMTTTHRKVQDMLKQNKLWRSEYELMLQLVLKRQESPIWFLNHLSRLLPLEKRNEVHILRKTLTEIFVRNGIMLRFGLDLGTKNIVLSFKDVEGKIKYRKEVNGFFKIPSGTQFAKNMLIQAGVPHIEHGSSFVALGSKAEDLAYTFNKTLRRPMSDGVLSNGEEDSIEIMGSIVQSLIGEIKDDGILYYCVPAKALNRNINVDFHQKVAQMIINGYESRTGKKLQGHAINEAHALVLASISDKTGIGISFGAGMVNVSYCLFGIPVFNFSLVGSGDWIDVESAKQFGFDPAKPEGDYRQTPTSICKAKEQTSLREMPTDPIKRAIYIHYQILMENVISGIISGFKDNEDKARVAKPMPIVLAGGTSSPDGFIEMFKELISKKKPSFEIGEITRPEKPLFTVAEGCLIAAEFHEIKETK